MFIFNLESKLLQVQLTMQLQQVSEKNKSKPFFGKQNPLSIIIAAF